MDILVVDDFEPIRDEMVDLIREQKHMRVVGEASNGREAIDKADEIEPDLVVMDVMMPILNGIEATKAIHKAHPDMLLLALSNHTGTRLVETVIEAGAKGYVRKDQAYEELIPAINTVSKGELYVGDNVKD